MGDSILGCYRLFCWKRGETVCYKGRWRIGVDQVLRTYGDTDRGEKGFLEDKVIVGEEEGSYDEIKVQ